MLTRKEAQEYYLKMLDKEIIEHGEDFIFVRAPKIGKNQWTLGEFKKAVEADEIPDEYCNNPIDEMIKFETYLNERGRTTKDSDSWKELMNKNNDK